VAVEESQQSKEKKCAKKKTNLMDSSAIAEVMAIHLEGS
jgi:hypothetical protein